jgi:hypothetical protein
MASLMLVDCDFATLGIDALGSISDVCIRKTLSTH